jgi:hypothetical protein
VTSQSPTKSIRAPLAALLLAGSLLMAVGQAYRLVPAAWDLRAGRTGWASYFNSASDYDDPNTGKLVGLDASFATFHHGRYVTTSVELVVILKDYPTEQVLDRHPLRTRQEALDAIRSNAAKLLPGVNPESAPLLPAALATPGVGVVRTCPERAIAEWGMTARRVVLVLLVFTCLVFTGWVVYRLRRQRLSRLLDPLLCQTCGYDRHGLAMDAVCPECGNQGRA